MTTLRELDGTDRYRASLRNAVRGVWNSAIDYDQFFDVMLMTVRRFLTMAWQEGAKECGVLLSDMSPEERIALEQAIAYENQWIAGLGNAAEEGSRANGGMLTPLYVRLETWIGRYKGVRDKAKTMSCGDKKLKWVQGPTEKSCSSCSKLNGKVKRASYWNRVGVLPRVHGSPYLACNGFRCQCELLVTDEPCSPGPLPSLP